VRSLAEKVEKGRKGIEESREVLISDLGHIVTGKTPSTKNPAFFGGEYQFVTPSDLEWKTYYCRSTERYVTDEAKQKHPKQFIPADAVMVTCIGNTIGKCGISASECLTNQQINTIVPYEGIDPKFVYYLIVHNIGLIRGVGVGGGAATPIINKSTFSKIRLQVPSRRTWKAIASILSTFDDLIENNRRRIQLLEQAARLLYKEWFVHFRFPGHEHVKIIDGVPEGWEICKVGEKSTLIRGKSYKSSDLVESGGKPFVNLKCVARHGGFRLDGLKRFSGSYRNDQIVVPGDIVIAVTDMTRERHLVAHPARIPSAIGEEAVFSMDILKIIPSETVDRFWFYYFLRYSNFSQEVREHATGTNVLHLKPKQITDFVSAFPPRSLQEQFGEIARSILEQQDNLIMQNERLAKARDLLLPRLMNGEIAV